MRHPKCNLIKISMIKSLWFLFIAGLMIACDNSMAQNNEKDVLKPDSAMLRSKTIFTNYCSNCHGSLMQAFVDREWKYGNSPEALYKSIAEGRGGSEAAMPAFGKAFSDQQIKELVQYIRYGIENVDKYDFQEKTIASDTFKSEEFSFTLETVVNGLEIPWGMAFLPDGDMLVTERDGKLYRVKKGGILMEISGVPSVKSEGQGGLLDIELHPKFSENGWIYLSYSIFKPDGKEILSSTAVSRFRLKGNELIDKELVFEALPYSDTRHHYGSRLEFDNDGYLYITVGDRGAREVNPQDLSLFPGKVHRIHDDGRIPEDNPFVNQPGAVKSIFSYGHRNPQGLVINPTTGLMWSHEHGPRGGDEINIIQKGANYGWPVISHGINYDGTIFTTLTEKEGMEQPVHYWVPSIAPCGMDVVRGDRYSGWKGHLLVGSLRFEYLNLCKIDGNKVLSEEILMKNIGRVRNVKQAPDGYIYVAVEEPGVIYKIIPLQ
jgi:glucose/arabinose dehydrogenase